MKYNFDDSIERYEARLVAQGFSQVHGIDNTEAFTLIMRYEALRILLAISRMLGIILIQIDVIGAYLVNIIAQNK